MITVFEFSENGTSNSERVNTHDRLREITARFPIEVNQSIGVDQERKLITGIVVEALSYVEGSPSVHVFVNYDRNV